MYLPGKSRDVLFSFGGDMGIGGSEVPLTSAEDIVQNPRTTREAQCEVNET